VAFIAVLTGGSSSGGIFVGAPGSLQAAALRGELAPAGGNYRVFDDLVLNSSGQVAFRATLTDRSSTDGIFAGAPGALQTVALQGAAAPDGLGYFDSFTNPVAINAAGEVAFAARLGGVGVTSANDLGLYAWSGGKLITIVREGETIDVDQGPGVDLRIVDGFNFIAGSSGERSKGTGFNDSGQLAYFLNLDRGAGIFTSQIVIPEPASLSLISVAIVALLGRCRRQALSK
jgi:hypothetical protein